MEPTLREKVNAALDLMEQRELEQNHEQTFLQKQSDSLREEYATKIKELNEREMQVANREAAIAEIRIIAANRKAEIETLKEQVARENKKRLAAEDLLRHANEQKSTLEKAFQIANKTA